MKRCRDCQQDKPLDEFHVHGHTRDGRNVYCKPCANARATASRNARADAVRAYDRERYVGVVDGRIVKRRIRIARTVEQKATAARAASRRFLRTEAGAEAGRRNAKARRARLRGAAVIEAIDPFRVWFLSAGCCGICGERVDAEAMDVDHIIPLARGGNHTYDNTQASHPGCNRRKGARVLQEA